MSLLKLLHKIKQPICICDMYFAFFFFLFRSDLTKSGKIDSRAQQCQVSKNYVFGICFFCDFTFKIKSGDHSFILPAESFIGEGGGGGGGGGGAYIIC